MQQGKVRKLLEYAGGVAKVATAIAGCGMQPPDPTAGISARWRPAVNTAYHFATVGAAVTFTLVVYHRWWTVASSYQQVIGVAGGWFG